MAIHLYKISADVDSLPRGPDCEIDPAEYENALSGAGFIAKLVAKQKGLSYKPAGRSFDLVADRKLADEEVKCVRNLGTFYDVAVKVEYVGFRPT